MGQVPQLPSTVIAAVDSSGLKISDVTSDMGPINVGLWNQIGIKSMKTVTVPFVSHPCTSERGLYFLADPPYLLKNLWNCLRTHTLELDDDVVKKHSLPSRNKLTNEAFTHYLDLN
jgi:hypothetical protein